MSALVANRQLMLPEMIAAPGGRLGGAVVDDAVEADIHFSDDSNNRTVKL